MNKRSEDLLRASPSTAGKTSKPWRRRLSVYCNNGHSTALSRIALHDVSSRPPRTSPTTRKAAVAIPRISCSANLAYYS
eukprot:2132369-Amphidinium_carterae.1